MPNNATIWKTDNYKFVGKEFDYRVKNMLNSAGLFQVIGKANTDSIDYEITGMGGFSELLPYDGTNLVHGTPKRGFKTVVTPGEFNQTYDLGKKQVKNDRTGQTKKAGAQLGTAAGTTLYLHALRMFARAFDSAYKGGDGKAWAATDHPVASKASEGRGYIVDEEAGTFSNLITRKLSTTAIDDARVMASRFVTPSGLPCMTNYNLLLVSPELEPTAAKLLGRDKKLTPLQDPESAENAASSISDLRYMVVGAGTDGFVNSQWAICDTEMMKETTLLVETTAPTVMETELDNPLIQRFVAYADFAFGFGDARPIIFSNGTA